MTCYVIGDVQGCYHELQCLLQRIQYNDTADQIIFAGDLVNRGPYSLETLELIRSLNNVRVTLGNHDLYTLALGYQAIKTNTEHTLQALLGSPNLIDHLEWLRQQSIFVIDERYKLIVAHAGLVPQWSLSEAKQYANELSTVLRGPNYLDFLSHMLGNQPKQWHASLRGYDRLRYITNAFTRLRFCSAQGKLELKLKSQKTIDNPAYQPWFNWPRDWQGYHMAFGHWAALQGECNIVNIHATDTGCVWGGKLRALCIEDDGRRHWLSVPSTQKKP